MEIKTKYNIDDTVFVLYRNLIIEGIIYNVRTSNKKHSQEEYYVIQQKDSNTVLGAPPEYPYDGEYFDLSKVHSTKEELIDSLREVWRYH